MRRSRVHSGRPISRHAVQRGTAGVAPHHARREHSGIRGEAVKLPLLEIAICALAAAQTIPDDALQRVFREASTTFKYGIVIPEQDGKKVDCPRVFRIREKWYMHYVCMNGVGYETHLASSDDLLKWRPEGKVLSFGKQGW